MSSIDELIARVAKLPPVEQSLVHKEAFAKTANMKWVPNCGPQTEAYFSKADVLLYGGEPGGGKSQLCLGLAFNEHKRTLLMRRQYGDLGRLIEDALAIHGSKDGFNGSPPPKLRVSDGHIIDFAAAHRVGDEHSQMGRGRDLLCVERGTAVVMGDGMLCPIESLRVGDMVMTLEGPKPIVNVLPVRFDRGVRVSIERGGFRYSQVQSMTHSLLTDAGWVSCDTFCGPLPFGSSSPTEPRAACRTSLPFWQRFSASLLRHGRTVAGLLRSVIPAPLVRGHSNLMGTYACASPPVLGSACAGSCESSRGSTPRSLWSNGAGHLPRSPSMAGFHDASSNVRERGVAGDHASSKLEGSTGRCSFDSGLGDGQPRLLIRRGTSLMGDQASSLRQADVGRQTPNDSARDDLGRTPKHTSRTEWYCHPYTKETRRILGEIEFCSFEMEPVGVVELHDLEVQDANHYITFGGFVNKNCIDEATHFAESQIRFLMGWNRSEDPNQRVRTVLATNPPLTAEGLWVIKMFAPWLDPTYPNPAKSGELRWVVSDEDGNDRWVDGPESGYINKAGKLIRPTSRTYIPAKVSDNPYYAASDYERQLDAMPEPYRSLLMGGFKTAFRDQPDQVIPTKWVQMAQERWTKTPPKNVPMCAIGVDASGGGEDPMILARRYDGWFAELIEVAGKDIPIDRSGAHCAGIVISHRRDDALVVIDMGGGYGGPMYEHLKANRVEANKYKGAEASTRRSRDGKLRFTNKRTAALWTFREALDPGQPGGSPIMLPPDSKLLADLTAPTFSVTPNGLKAETKESVCDRLGRSTDRGDAVMMAWFEGPRMLTDAMDWMDRIEIGGRLQRRPVAITGRQPLSAQRR